MAHIVSKEEWLKQWGNASLEHLRAGAKEFGHTLRAKTKADALDEAYELYAGRLKGTIEPQVPPAASAPVAPSKPLEYEGRCVGHGVTTRRRAGKQFTRLWTHVGILTADEIAQCEADPFIRVRVAK